MAYKFTDAGLYPYEPGGFFLGADDYGREVGIQTERHLITVAGAGSGKGAALIVPNLKRWPGSCVVVDPKGENATITAGERADMGQTVGVVDPYEIASGKAAGLRCSINPLAALDPAALTIRADLEALGDGLIRRFDPKHAQWDNTAALICAGIADFVLAWCLPEERTLLSVRSLLLTPEEISETNDKGETVKRWPLKDVAQQMAATVTAAGLAKQAGTLILNKLSNPEGVPASAFERAATETGWIDDPAFAAVLGGDALPAFDLATLKAGTGSLYLCIPPAYLDVRGGFLRLFVRMGLLTMTRDLAAHGGGGRCLFLLDEFHSLGKIELVAKAAGLMRGYGVQLWPFLQDFGQLVELYGQEGAGTFFGNADAHIFFGNTDAFTLDWVSQRLGHVTPEEIGPPPASGGGGGILPMMAPQRRRGRVDAVGIGIGIMQSMNNAGAAAAQAQYQHKQMTVGRPRVPPDQVRELAAKHDGDKVARSMIVFAKGRHVLNLRLAPYFGTLRPVAGPHIALSPKELAGIVGARLGLAVLLAAPLLLFVLLGARTAPEGGWPAPLLLLTGGLYAALGWWLWKARAGERLRRKAGVPF